MTSNNFHETAIKALGGGTKVAGLFGIKPQSVNDWRTHGIPPKRILQMMREHPHAYRTLKKLNYV